LTNLVVTKKSLNPIGLHRPLDGVTNLKYKLLHFLTTKIFFAKKRTC
jgi:hypothetical protein